MKKTILTLALAALSVSAANAATVTGMTLGDTINTSGTASTADDTLGSDGYTGTFTFFAIYSGAYANVSLFSGDINNGVIKVTGATSSLEWTTGTHWGGLELVPFTTGAINADITGGVLTVASLPLAYDYSGVIFNMSAENLDVMNLIQTGVDTYAYRISFSHYITSEDDPTLEYQGLTAYWIMEGTMSTSAVPIPAAAWLMGSGLLGLAGVARRRRSV